MKIAVCDDSAIDCSVVERLCASADFIDKAEVRSFLSGNDLLCAASSGERFDIVFLDVDMPGKTGIEVGNILRESFPKMIIIFITSHPEYALESYDCEAFHYFVKPFEETKFYTVLRRAMTRLGITKKYHIVKKNGFPVKIALSEIYYVEYCQKHVIYHLKDHTVDTVDKLSNVYEKLAEYGFLQTHQGYIVNMDKIESFTKNAVVLQDGTEIMLSARKKQEVLMKYFKYIERCT